MEFSFDFNNEREYISTGLENEKRLNGILIFKRSTADLACYVCENNSLFKCLHQHDKFCEKWVVEQGLFNKWLQQGDIMDRDFVWECEYGERMPIIKPLCKWLSEQKADELSMCTLFVNNDPYHLEFFIGLGYENPTDEQIEEMKKILKESGARYRPDVTVTELIELTLKGRFNSAAVSSPDQLLSNMSVLFLFKDRAEMESKIPMTPLGKKLPVFLSHSSYDKPLVEDVIPYLSGYGLPVWYDKINIDYGKSIVSEIQKGIKDSGAVIFFISHHFLASSWCNVEMEGFLTRYAGGNKVLILSLVFPDINHQDLPIFFQNLKYVRLTEPCDPKTIASELVPTIKRHFKL